MGAPKIRNRTPFEFAANFVTDVDGRPLFAPLLKATFAIEPGGHLAPAKKQAAILPGGEWWGPPESSSLKFEPEATLVKPATDVVLIGHAYPDRAGAVETLVGLSVGGLRKVVRVVGDRWWVRRHGMLTMTAPLPFEKIPLRWERAFGGRDQSSPNPDQHRHEPRNPVGAGFRVEWHDGQDRVALPNLEDPDTPIRSFDDRPTPFGFGFVSHDWQPRVRFAGTYDAVWSESRRPLLPVDFDRRFFNAAPADQIVPGYLTGTEPVMIVNASFRGPLRFSLPGGAAPPTMEVVLQGGTTQALQPVLDTVIIDTDEHQVSMLWRAGIAVTDVPAGVKSIDIEWDGDGVAPDYRRFSLPRQG